ncbi:MAG: dihydropteroate synthase [Myxococcales bacterium]|nr:dihydropteroate synthase [Myxococcales bacterium]
MSVRILGILNLSPDSFSDGGRFSAPDVAVAHGRSLVQDGAWAVDIGAVSSNPDSAGLSEEAELERVRAVLDGLGGVRISVDTFAPGVQRALAAEVDVLNDIRGFPDPSVWPVLADADCTLVVMHALQEGPADRRDSDPDTVVDRVMRFFDARLEALVGAGIAEDRVVLDPGMGFFLGSRPEASLAVLRAVPALRTRYGRPVLISVSRKSFLGALIGGRPPLERGPATLAAELFAVDAGATWIRTHDVRALTDALAVREALYGQTRPASGSPVQSG